MTLTNIKITDENLIQFRRFVKKPRDCVINCLQVVGIIDEKNAEIMRILVGDKGIEAEEIRQLFVLLKPDFTWRFAQVGNIDNLSAVVALELLPGHVCLCGIQFPQGKHVFLIGKTLDGKTLLIDPQLGIILDINTNINAMEYLRLGQMFWILQNY